MLWVCLHSIVFFFFFNDTATTEIYTLSLHDALPICFVFAAGTCQACSLRSQCVRGQGGRSISIQPEERLQQQDRKSTRLNSSHGYISYAVFCLKKKKNHDKPHSRTKSRSTTS